MESNHQDIESSPQHPLSQHLLFEFKLSAFEGFD